MTWQSDTKLNIYSRRLRTTLSFLMGIADHVGAARVMVLSLKLLRAKWINLTSRLAERVFPHQVQCPCCGWSGVRFRTIFFGSYLRDDCGCPCCKSMERHRAYFLFYSGLQFSKIPVVLYFAPESSLYLWLRQRCERVITTDLFAPGVHVRADLMQLPFKTSSVDVIINHHVLEHVPNDFMALEEFERIMKPEGRMFISVPLNETLAVTWDWGYPDPVKQDHFRDYGQDFPQRLSLFECTAIDIPATLPRQLVLRYGLDKREVLYLCRKRSTKRPIAQAVR